jgi:hypothetical protein
VRFAGPGTAAGAASCAGGFGRSISASGIMDAMQNTPMPM